MAATGPVTVTATKIDPSGPLDVVIGTPALLAKGIDFADLVGKHVMVYSQHNVVQDLIAARLIGISFQLPDVGEPGEDRHDLVVVLDLADVHAAQIAGRHDLLEHPVLGIEQLERGLLRAGVRAQLLGDPGDRSGGTEDIDEIIDSHLRGGKPVERLRI